MEQPPSRVEKPVNFLSASGFQVVPGKFHDIQLPQGQPIEHADRRFVVSFFVMRFSLGHRPFADACSRALVLFRAPPLQTFSSPHVNRNNLPFPLRHMYITSVEQLCDPNHRSQQTKELQRACQFVPRIAALEFVGMVMQ
jgi:hypothetical protein